LPIILSALFTARSDCSVRVLVVLLYTATPYTSCIIYATRSGGSFTYYTYLWVLRLVSLVHDNEGPALCILISYEEIGFTTGLSFCRQRSAGEWTMITVKLPVKAVCLLFSDSISPTLPELAFPPCLLTAPSSHPSFPP
jgi:hypothetical protein